MKGTNKIPQKRCQLSSLSRPPLILVRELEADNTQPTSRERYDQSCNKDSPKLRRHRGCVLNFATLVKKVAAQERVNTLRLAWESFE